MARVDNVDVYGIPQSIYRSGYPMLKMAPTRKEFIESTIEIATAITDKKYDNPHIKRAIQLAQSKGGGHDQFLTGIHVDFDLTVSNKCWGEAERYRFLDFISSMSSMHRAAFFKIGECCNEYASKDEIAVAEALQEKYNSIDGKEYPDKKKSAYLDLLYNIPSGFELMAGMTTNYRCLKNVFAQRNNHRLPDWHVVCDWIKTLPLANELIIGGGC